MTMPGPAVVGRRDAVRTMGVGLGCTAAGTIPMFLVGTMSVRMQEDLGFDEAVLGLVLACRLAVSAVFAILAGRAVQRLGPATGVRAGVAISATSMLGVAVVARSAWSLTPFVALSGLAGAILQPSSDLWLAQRLPANRQGLGFGVKQTGQPVAAILAGLAVPLIATTVGWRWAFVATSVSVSLVALGVRGSATPLDQRVRRTGRPDVETRTLVLMAAAMGLGAASVGVLSSFIVTAAVHSDVQESTAGLMVALGSAFGIVMRIVLGRRADRRPRGILATIATMLVLGGGGYLLLGTSTRVGFFVAIPLVFGAGWAWTGLFGLTVVRANPNAPATAIGITQTGAQIGAMFGPAVFGAVVTGSHAAAWGITAAMAFTSAGLMITARARLRRGAFAPSVSPAGPS